MQAVILAAGKGTRMGNLTQSVPKPMLTVQGKNLLQHKMDLLPDSVEEVIIVVGYLGNAIVDRFGNSYNGRPVRYAWQKELRGTFDSLLSARELLKDRFMVMMGDDIYGKDDLAFAASHPWSLGVRKVASHEKGARVIIKDGKLHAIIETFMENPHGDSGLVNIGLYVLGKEIFDFEPVQLPGRNEFGLPQTIVKAAEYHPVAIVETATWIQMTSPEDIAKAEAMFSM